MQIKLDKATFNRFDVATQVKYFNSELEKGFTISEVCKKLNISYNTIRDRFLRSNYIYNKVNKKYEISNSVLAQLESEMMNQVLEKLVTKVFNYGSRESKINDFSCNCKGTVTNRSFRIYDEVLKDFVTFCENSNYSQYDILSQFIVEGIQRYSK
ncbi:MAG: hypothetical protein IJ086_14030 [Clostridium sp.]|nr:hypothetical protein [Clostridium sp.]MBQ9072691.1 hypothetical protein [Bacilli bacterium]